MHPQSGKRSPDPQRAGLAGDAARDINLSIAAQTAPRVARHDQETVIAANVTLEGTLRSAGDIHVLGSVQGEIESTARVVIEPTGRVSGTIRAQAVTISGQVEGQIHCHGRLELQTTGRIDGEIESAVLVIHEGGRLNGSSHMSTAR